MEVKTLPSKTLTGLKVRTCNSNEMNGDTAKIAGLWQDFYQQFTDKLSEKSSVYGVYTNYETDMSGDFDVIACCDTPHLNTPNSIQITTQAGRYLVFNAHGSMPDAVIDLWGEIWQYFSSEDCRYTRTYQSDYEYYKSTNAVEIAISITG